MKTEHIQLEADERILLQVRKHWFVLSMQMLSVVVLALVPLILYAGALMFVRIPGIILTNTGIIIILYTTWLILMWMALFNVWTNYYLDLWTITNKRLIAVDQKGFFSRTTASFRLERLQDIIVNIHGIVPTLFNYGSLEIQTAGEEKNFKATGLPNPSAIKGIILNSTDVLIANGNKSQHSGV